MTQEQQPATVAKTNTMAITSFILSLCGAFWILPVVGQILGIVFGIMGMNQIKETREQGRGLALAGVIISIVSIVLGVLLIGLLIFVIAVSEDKSKQIEPTINRDYPTYQSY